MPEELVPGTILDNRYKITKHLGGGGFGQTYLAQDTRQFDQLCVVKQLKPNVTNQEGLTIAKRLFESEAQLLHKLGSHDQIPRLLAYFAQKQEFYLVQEFIDGNDLTKEIVPGRKMPELRVIELLKSILTPLAFVHENQVIHRDIKPPNLIRRKSDNKIVLIDFGAVKQVRGVQVDNAGNTTHTIAIGTHGYMPSEQGRGYPRFSSDVYAVGVIGIQVLTGIRVNDLLEDQNTGELIWEHLAQAVKPELIAVLSTMVKYHFKERYPSAIEALRAIACINEPTLINPPEVNSLSPLTQILLEWVEYGEVKSQLISGENQETKIYGKFRIGRDSRQCDLVLSDLTVSSLHVEIFYNSQQRLFCITNLKENNPPIIDGFPLPLGTVYLKVGSVIKLGQVELRVKNVPNNYVTPPTIISLGKEQSMGAVPDTIKNIYGGGGGSYNLISGSGINYSPLKEALSRKLWTEADRETKLALLKLANRQAQGWLDVPSIRKLGSEDLKIIDQLWSDYSGKQFGFLVQRMIWSRLSENWMSFGVEVGWKNPPGAFGGMFASWKKPSEIMFDLRAPVGHLPGWFIWIGVEGGIFLKELSKHF